MPITGAPASRKHHEGRAPGGLGFLEHVPRCAWSLELLPVAPAPCPLVSRVSQSPLASHVSLGLCPPLVTLRSVLVGQLHLSPVKLAELHADLKIQERDELNWKKLKIEGFDEDGEKEAKLVRNLNGAFYLFSFC